MAIDNSEISNEIKKSSRLSLFQRLAARFGFAVSDQKERKSSYKIIQKPTPLQLEGKDTKGEMDLISALVKKGKMSSSIQDLFDEWLNDTQNTYSNIYERQQRLDAFTNLCDNEGLIKNAVTLVAAETAMLTEVNAFSVLSEDTEWQDKTNILLSDVWGYKASDIYSIAWDMFLYGEAFRSKEVSSGGIVATEAIKVNEIVERVEFKPSQMANFFAEMGGSGGGNSTGFAVHMMNQPTSGSFNNTNLNFNQTNGRVTYQSKDNLLKNYLENLNDTSSNEFFTSHLLGYRVANDTLVAPWQVTHFRYNAQVSEFDPYGQPPLLACLAAYKQLQRSMGLDDLRNLLSFPIYMYKVKTGGATTARAFDIVNDVKEEFENVGLMSQSSGMEGPSLCTNIWTSDDLVTIEKVGGDAPDNSATVDKLKFFQQRVSSATGIPLSYLDPSSENFQMSGVALMALFKPFRNLVEQIRNIIIEMVEDDIILHYSILNEPVPEFVLTLNVENPVATEDLSSKMQLVDTILDTVANMLNLEDKAQLPATVKKDIISKYGGLSKTELEGYEDILEKEGPEEAEEEGLSQEEADADFGDADFGDEGGGEEEGGEDMGESIQSIRRKKQRLIEARYKNTKQEDIKYLLVEKLGQLKTPRGTSHFCRKTNSRFNKEVIRFIKERNKMKRGKKRIRG